MISRAAFFDRSYGLHGPGGLRKSRPPLGWRAGQRPAPALPWILAQGDGVAPIPGTKRRTYSDEKAATMEIELSAGDLTELSQAAPLGSTAGARYPKSSMVAVNR